MGKVEKTRLQDTINGLVFYGRYVDDIFCLADGTTDTEDLVQKFNSAHPSLKFTPEVESVLVGEKGMWKVPRKSAIVIKEITRMSPSLALPAVEYTMDIVGSESRTVGGGGGGGGDGGDGGTPTI
ncbi:hypothetical protein SprV_0100028100 [Sparganum proliferum]